MDCDLRESFIMSTIGNEQLEEDASSETTIMPDNYESFFADGRLLVKVGNGANAVNFQVSLSIFRLASPIRRTLTTKTDDSLPADSAWETVDRMIEFPSGQTGAFHILFCLAHLQFHNAPSQMSLKDLTDLAEASCHYKMSNLARPYIGDWQKPHTEQGLNHAVVNDWIWIGRV
jgi:hypothetical protein